MSTALNPKSLKYDSWLTVMISSAYQARLFAQLLHRNECFAGNLVFLLANRRHFSALLSYIPLSYEQTQGAHHGDITGLHESINCQKRALSSLRGRCYERTGLLKAIDPRKKNFFDRWIRHTCQAHFSHICSQAFLQKFALVPSSFVRHKRMNDKINWKQMSRLSTTDGYAI